MKKKVYFYSVYERIWHWVQAVGVAMLLLTGFMISFSGPFAFIEFKAAVSLHNTIGIIVMLNAFLALFYNAAGGLLKRYIPGIEDFFTLGFTHVSYYLYGIFKGDPHPFDKTPAKRLLPLQKIAYFMVLNGLLPLMVITGLLKWSMKFTPVYAEMFGGLSILGPIHRFGAWLFLAFVIGHVYMTTTGHAPLSSIVSMITGYEFIEENSKKEQIR
ncbi:MAG: cytochrome b/b6 domain-containing protein [Desulfobacterales bacterium]|jgi:thiosulfate reductase cytochrome b subunit